MDILHLTKNEFHPEIASGTALVDFWASWCAPCRMLAPVIESLAEELGSSVKTAKVDVDAEGELALEYGVMSIPTVIIFKDGQEIKRFVGVQPKETYKSFLASIVSAGEAPAPEPAADAETAFEPEKDLEQEGTPEEV